MTGQTNIQARKISHCTELYKFSLRSSQTGPGTLSQLQCVIEFSVGHSGRPQNKALLQEQGQGHWQGYWKNRWILYNHFEESSVQFRVRYRGKEAPKMTGIYFSRISVSASIMCLHSEIANLSGKYKNSLFT